LDRRSSTIDMASSRIRSKRKYHQISKYIDNIPFDLARFILFQKKGSMLLWTRRFVLFWWEYDWSWWGYTVMTSLPIEEGSSVWNSRFAELSLTNESSQLQLCPAPVLKSQTICQNLMSMYNLFEILCLKISANSPVSCQHSNLFD
jgi:hypothetical protein